MLSSSRFHGWYAIFPALLLASSAAFASPLPGFVLAKAEPHRTRAKHELATERNPEVARWVRYFSIDDRDRFQKFLVRGATYKTLVEDILARNGVPTDIYYLAMIESGFRIDARSWAEAVGVWQFIRKTANRFGLHTNRFVDERLDILRSTEAAARYLKELRREFGSWNLAMAAYNCGEGRVRKAIRASGTRNYWRLARGGYLPEETANYVPKFHAARIVASNPRKFGLTPPVFLEYPKVKSVRVRGLTPLSAIAKKHRVSIEALRSLNPHLTDDITPRRSRGYSLWIPAQSSEG